MDISVSHLNGRLALKLPPELPLGLMFVVGEVAELGLHSFVLAEETHQLTCRADEEITSIAVGDEVRVSGHLMFDDRQLQYYLRAGDIECLTPEPLTPEPLSDNDPQALLATDDGLLNALKEVKARATVSSAENQEALPIWVKKLAPKEAGLEIEPDEAGEQSRYAGLAEGELDAGLVALLSEAMDSEDEMELTPELLAPYLPPEPDPVEKGEEVEVFEEETAVSLSTLSTLSTSYQPANRRDTDWLVILLILSFFVLTIAAIVTIILLLIQ
jgi:hypothetical protein